LQFTHGTLQFRVLLGVFLREFIQLSSEFRLSRKKSNGQKGSDEQQQPKENQQEDGEGHGCSSDSPLD
jgi:hypothetical protein